ncbi:MAG TPA: HAD-IB family hydrolase [Acidimicrobiales bacterium]|nr:HAD-IB family hydrolase [Acidimicrobiales bacterium]
MITTALEGKRIGITGATGFLGTALVERLLRCVPGCEVVVVVRAGKRTPASQRVKREILRNDCFDRLRAEWSDAFDAETDRRLKTVAGDVSVDGLGLNDEDRRLFRSCDIVVHSAASVSFDSPLDAAVEVNLLGGSRVARVLAGDRPQGAAVPHLVAVSTAYVAGTRRGESPEALLADTPFAIDLDWEAEAAAARQARADADAESRRPERLTAFSKAARSELGAAGAPLLADKLEKLRVEWVRERMVQAGKSRAHSLGWPDAYAYTKALGERALLANRGDLPVSIVRPSIIESALAEPHAGWIRGFRMAEPVIISYGRGLLKQFPGIPEGVVDVIPVDMVVAAIIAVAARGPEPEGPDVVQVASGQRNPLRYRRLVRLVQTWFEEHPLYDADGQPIVVPEWSFPGRGKVQRQLQHATKALSAVEKAITTLPIRGKKAELSSRLEEKRTLAERALGYVELYGAYAETEAVFKIERLLALFESLDDADKATFGFDPIVIDWAYFVQQVHLPSIVAQARVRTTPGKRKTASRQDRGRKAVLSPDRHIAAFDLENTLIASNVVESYSWLATRHLPADERMRFVLRTLKEAPTLLALDRRDRGDFLRHFYRRYEGASRRQVDADTWHMFSDLILRKAFPAGIRRVREHRALGHRTLLITGALDFAIEPLRPLFDDIVCAKLGTDADGRLTGELLAGPPTGEARALVMARYAEAEGLSLTESVAYADSASDLPMLEAVGHPVAVNPEAKLATIARKRGWHVEQWSKAPGAPRPLLPIGPILHVPRGRSRGNSSPIRRAMSSRDGVAG